MLSPPPFFLLRSLGDISTSTGGIVFTLFRKNFSRDWAMIVTSYKGKVSLTQTSKKKPEK